MEQTQEQREEFIARMNEQRITDFVESLQNKDDFGANRDNLITTAGKALEALQELEGQFLKDMLTEAKDEGICPACLASATADVVNIRNICQNFNGYLDGLHPADCDD